MEDNTNKNILDADDYIEKPDFLKKDDWYEIDIENDWLDPAERYERPKYTLSFKGVPFAPLGGIHALTGQPGNGKTMTFTQLIVAILRGQYGGLRYELEEMIQQPTVLYIDTEMEKGNTQLVQLRVYGMMDWDFGIRHDEFRILRLRETDSAEDRWRKILKAIYIVRPTVCFIDGLLDIVADFNKNEECQEIIYKCMKTASHYDISIWCLVHENPGSTKMVGHLGSMLERKVTDAFGTIKEKKDGAIKFKVVQKKARGKDIEDILFHVVDGPHKFGIPEQYDMVKLNAVQIDPIELADIMKKASEFGMNEPFTLSDLKKTITGVSHEKRNEYLQEMVKISKNVYIYPETDFIGKDPKWFFKRDQL